MAFQIGLLSHIPEPETSPDRLKFKVLYFSWRQEKYQKTRAPQRARVFLDDSAAAVIYREGQNPGRAARFFPVPPFVEFREIASSFFQQRGVL